MARRGRIYRRPADWLQSAALCSAIRAFYRRMRQGLAELQREFQLFQIDRGKFCYATV